MRTDYYFINIVTGKSIDIKDEPILFGYNKVGDTILLTPLKARKFRKYYISAIELKAYNYTFPQKGIGHLDIIIKVIPL